jgi:Bacteriophage tail sheath protein
LSVYDFIGEAASALDSDPIRAKKTRGIQALDQVEEIAIVAVPDIVIRPQYDPIYEIERSPERDPCLQCPPASEPARPFTGAAGNQELAPIFSDDQIHQVQAALIAHCESRGDRFAVLDPPYSAAQDDALGIAAIEAWRARFETTYAALYYPWLKVIEPRGTDTVRAVPPSGHVLGQYAFHDFATGVHRAPANKPLVWAQDLTVHVSPGRHAILNPQGINLVRSEPSRGLRIMGARTLSSDPDWRYVNVRRLLLMIREAVAISTQWVVFEPNNFITRNKLRVVLSSFLESLWQRGALTGAAAEQAFFVKCDEENNPPGERGNGRLLAEIGVAPIKPFEFVVIRIGRQANELEIAEAATLARAA